MSAFFLAINRNRTAFDQKLAARMMHQLDRFGDDSKKLIVKGHFALGYQSHWSVPEEVDEHQPIARTDGTWFVFHGRVDNRRALFDSLGIKRSKKMSDAELVCRHYSVFGEAGIEKIIGPFVFIHFDAANDTVFAARDAMGARYLVYRVTAQHILIATYEMALVAHGSFAYLINQEKAARYLLNEMENVPSSLVNGLEPLNPGMSLTLGPNVRKLTRYYRYSPRARIMLDSDREYAAEFRRLLDQAVRRRLRSIGDVGTMLSGGLDSVPMTISAIDHTRTTQQTLLAFSWVFDDYPDLDERTYSSPICQANNIEQVMVNCDRLWPKFDASTDLNPVIPFGIPFSEFQEETLRIAKARGVTTMLTGIHGDLLYEYTQGVFYELARQRKPAKALAEFLRLWNISNSKFQFIKLYLLRPLRVVQRVSAWRRRNKRFTSDVLRDEVAAKFQQQEHWLHAPSQAAIRPQQWQVIFDGFAGDDAVHGRYLDAKHGVERRYPFRDRDLAEFMLAIPSEQLYFNLIKRPIVKNAFENEFTPALFNRNDKTNFSQVIYAGIDADTENLKWFESGRADWQQYVKHCYFDAKPDEIDANTVVRWRCGYYAYWKSTCYNPVGQDLGLSKAIEK